MEKTKLITTLKVIFTIITILNFQVCLAESYQFQANLSLPLIFSPDYLSTGGIMGSVNTGGKIELSVFDESTSTVLYKITLTESSPSTFSGTPTIYTDRTQLGAGAEFYPMPWQSDKIKYSAFSFEQYRISIIDHPVIFPMLQSSIFVLIKIEVANAVLNLVRVPGVGIINAQGKNALFDAHHYCADLKNSSSAVCAIWENIKQPDINSPNDVIVATHRGWWGYNLGTGPPENSVSGVNGASQVSPSIESDVTWTEGNGLICTHDYALNRLTNIIPADANKRTFQKTESYLTTLNLRRRNTEVSNDNMMSFDVLLDALRKNNEVTFIDIKAKQCHWSKTLDSCIEYPEWSLPAVQEESWLQIFASCLLRIKALDAYQYVSFKTIYTYQDLEDIVSKTKGLSIDDLAKIQYMPQVTEQNGLNNFVTDWHNKAGWQLSAYETNFKTPDDERLQPFTLNGITYANTLEYIYKLTGLRGGIFSEEPVGPKGVVSRWADWEMKNTNNDFRADNYGIVSFPYTNHMVITSDRPDIWTQIRKMSNNDNKIN